MSTQDKATPAAGADDLPATESRLGQALAIIHRILPRLDEPARKAEVQSALSKLGSLIESARQAYASEHGGVTPVVAPGQPQKVATGVAPEIAAVIAAAVAVLFKQPYRLVSVQQVATPVPHLNVWALEGRTQIFQSHRIR